MKIQKDTTHDISLLSDNFSLQKLTSGTSCSSSESDEIEIDDIARRFRLVSLQKSTDRVELTDSAGCGEAVKMKNEKK